MTMLYRSKNFQTALKGGMLFTAAISGLVLEAIATNAAPEMTTPGNPGQAVAPLIISGRQSARPAGTYSAGIAEVIKMLDAKLDAQVILAFIQNSPIPYNPDATELIALKEHGASTEMMTSLLHHGDELRLQLAQAQSSVNSSPAAPVYDYPPEAAYPAYPAPDSAEVPYPTTYYAYAYRWPWLCRTPVCVNSYQPYWYDHGCWYLHPGDHHLAGVSGERHGGVIASAPQVAHSVSAPSSGHTSAFATRSSGPQGSGHLGGRSGGRSR